MVTDWVSRVGSYELLFQSFILIGTFSAGLFTSPRVTSIPQVRLSTVREFITGMLSDTVDYIAFELLLRCSMMQFRMTLHSSADDFNMFQGLGFKVQGSGLRA